MKRSVALLAVGAVILLAACENRESGEVLQPAFAKVSCDLSGMIVFGSVTRQDVVDRLYVDIDSLFTTRNAQKAAKGHVDNIAREVCDGDWDAALSHVNSLVQQVEGQDPKWLADHKGLAADLVNWAIVLATDVGASGLAIPEGAFTGSGTLTVVDLNADETPVTTGEFEAAVRVADFVKSGTPFLLAIAEDPANGGWDIVTNGEVPVDGSILIQMCGDEQKALGHEKDGGGTELLEPVNLEEGGQLVVDCSTQPTVGSAQSGSLKGLPSWLRTVGRLASGAVRKVFGPTPLYADYFGQKGLGGLANSFSPFYPVDVMAPLDPSAATMEIGDVRSFTTSLFGTTDETLAVDWTIENPVGTTVAELAGDDVTGSGTGDDAGRTVSTQSVEAVGWGTATITATFTGHYSTGAPYTFERSATITVLPPMRELTVQLENLTPHDLVVTDGGDFTCILDTGKGDTSECTVMYRVNTQLTLTATAWSTGSSGLPLSSGHHIKIHGPLDPNGDPICDKTYPEDNEPSAFCTFDMPDGTPSISFTLTN